MTKKYFIFEGEPIAFQTGMTVAAALLKKGEYVFRNNTPSGNPRGAYCMMGSCYECLVEIDGLPNQQACQVIATENMSIKRQTAIDFSVKELS